MTEAQRDRTLLLKLRDRIKDLNTGLTPDTQAAVDTLQAAILALQAADLAHDAAIAALQAADTAQAAAIALLQAADIAFAATDADLQSQLDALSLLISNTVNLIANPSVEAGDDGYEGTGSGTFVRSNAVGVPYVGEWGLRVSTINADASGIKYTAVINTANLAHTLSVYARLATAGSHAMYFYLDWYDNADVFIGEDALQFTLSSTTYARFPIAGFAPVGAAYVQAYCVTDGAVGAFDFFTDGWQLEEGSAATTLDDGSDLEARLAAIETMLAIGDPGGFMDWGESEKLNAWPDNHSGYDRLVDKVYAGGQVVIATQDDAPTALFRRRENGPTPLGTPDNMSLGRFDWEVVDKFGNSVFPNGSDNAALALGGNLHVPGGGVNVVDAWSHFGLQVISELEVTVTKPPRTVFRVSGENGGELWGTTYDSSGAVLTDVKLFPRPDVFGS